MAGDRTVTYAELDETADRWAHDLAAAGAGPRRYVPVLVPRSPELVIALLSVLKTGAAYALLDPAWPAGRLREVVAQLDAPLVCLPDDPRAAALGVPLWHPPSVPADHTDFRPAATGSAAPCCVFFTSGTTGTPKGVVSPHEATTRLFRAGTFARFGPATVTPLAAAMPWDAFSLELWSALLNGGTSVVVAEPYLSAEALRGAVRDHGADTVWLTSSLFNMVVDEDLDAFDGLRQVMTGGERLSPPHVRAFLARHPAVALINGYGPVESTVFATTHRIGPDDCDLPGGIPVGTPVPGTGVHVLDGDRPCDPGEEGEICVSGDGLAVGYLGDDDLTAQRFPVVVLGGVPVRVYRTGDLGVRDRDGVLHFRGRLDRQVKIRGHRVEPAEVERQVEALLPAVRRCRVVPRGDAGGAVSELLAFCVPHCVGDRLPDAADVLRRSLAPHHRPAAVVVVQRLPVTANGKLDEAALLAEADRAGARPAPAAAQSSPATGTVRIVRDTFAAVLGVSGVAEDVAFTELGGSSLAAGRVCARLSRTLDRPVPVSWLFAHPTAAALAARIDAPPPPGRAAQPQGQGGADVPLTAMQLVYLTRDLLDEADRTNLCLMVWVVEGELDVAVLEAAVAAVHRRHQALSAVYDPDTRTVRHSPQISPPPLEHLAGHRSQADAVAALRDELGDGLAPTEAEVWRVALAPVTGTVTVLGLVVHHVAFDGWSEAVLAADLASAYATALHQRQPDLGTRSLRQLHNERVRRLAYAGAHTHRERLARELAGAPPLRWPPVPVVPGAAPVAELTGVLDAQDLAQVDLVAGRAGVSRFAVLLGRCARAIADATGQADLTVGVPVAQRDGPGLDDVVGCHLTMVCIRLRGAALQDGPDAVRQTGRLVADALAAQDIAFDDLVGLAGRSSLFQVIVALQDNEPPRLALPGASASFLRQPYLDLPVDLHVELWPRGDGGLDVVVSYRSAVVPAALAHDLLKRLVA